MNKEKGGKVMNWNEVIENAKGKAVKCRFCPECNGIACKGQIPGLGGKGSGSSFIRNVEKLKEVRINLDVLAENRPIDTSSTLFSYPVSLPVFIAPIAGIKNNYGAELSESDYTEAVVKGAIDAGTLAFCGDGVNPNMFFEPVDIIQKYDGLGICTIKPWSQGGIDERINYIKDKKIFALASDVDAAGLPLLRNAPFPVENKSVEALAKLKKQAQVPFIVKGVMTVEGALKALEAGADAIVVSNHGGRVLDDCLATIEVLPNIKKTVGDKMTILVDGGFRSGKDVFKALALGADGVLIGRPIGLAAIGNHAEGVTFYLKKIQSELAETMIMTGCNKISDISEKCVTVLK